MKTFSERNVIVIGAIGVLLTAAIVAGALNYNKLPFVSSGKSYSAYFDEAGGLTTGAPVRVSGAPAGQVQSITLDGQWVLVTFTVADGIRLGDRTEASIKTTSVLGNKVLDLTTRGAGTLAGTIPVERTTSPYQLPDAIGDLTTTISGLDTGQLSASLAVLSQTLQDTPDDLRFAVAGIARFSETLNQRDAQLRDLLAHAAKATTVLGERSNDIVRLISDTNAVLAQLRTQSAALDEISTSISAVSRQLAGFIAENKTTLKPALEKLNGVLAILDNRKAQIQESIKGLAAYAMQFGETIAAGPFFNAYLANLVPGQFIQPFVDAAFSDLGLDPNVLLPSERTDPQVGQPGTPALPIPYPRTGQGGDPKLTLPDAITGNPGDPRYPYRESVPAPPPGGPPPGPPAPPPPDQQAPQPPTPSPVVVPAPDEVAPGPTDSSIPQGRR
ncbi:MULTISPECIES: MCE family protein [Mycolicibacterium]|nr:MULTISPECIES: MCE family protein [Mycolicibacterium]ABP43139.1 virulence factor Mce family protein [Mycolicibacterium gilvum PYR-GCK]ABM11359.1 virulence factor Mce family protein [Mycolicibacterium vanbaalenii PYR-1]ADT96900.1 virulence factor Mce family protein [Mycolicibacterium gilvum Spyr1]MBV5246940.1 MCE family protein [Mycolicibacterium sp. PAM1]MCV7131227.1 MCE family protein [Mycolicibacterium vanbaalenii PYR-1]